MKQHNYFSEFVFNEVSTWPDYAKWSVVILMNILLFWGGYVVNLQESFLVSHNLQEENSQLKNTVLQKKQQIKQKVFYRQQLKQLKIVWKSQAEQLLNSDDVSHVIAEINALGLENHLEFKRIRPLHKKQKQDLMFLPIELQVVGEYSQLAKFFSRLSSLAKWVELSDFLLILNDATMSKKLNLNLTINVFFNKKHKNIAEDTVKNTMAKRDPFQIDNQLTEEEMLKNFAIETLQFVGYLQQQQNYLALIAAPNGCIYQAKIGAEVGMQGGRVMHINHDYIEIVTKAAGVVKSQILKFNKEQH